MDRKVENTQQVVCLVTEEKNLRECVVCVYRAWRRWPLRRGWRFTLLTLGFKVVYTCKGSDYYAGLPRDTVLQ